MKRLIYSIFEAELEAVTLELIHDLNVSVDEGIKYGIDKVRPAS